MGMQSFAKALVAMTAVAALPAQQTYAPAGRTQIQVLGLRIDVYDDPARSVLDKGPARYVYAQPPLLAAEVGGRTVRVVEIGDWAYVQAVLLLGDPKLQRMVRDRVAHERDVEPSAIQVLPYRVKRYRVTWPLGAANGWVTGQRAEFSGEALGTQTVTFRVPRRHADEAVQLIDALGLDLDVEMEVEGHVRHGVDIASIEAQWHRKLSQHKLHSPEGFDFVTVFERIRLRDELLRFAHHEVFGWDIPSDFKFQRTVDAALDELVSRSVKRADRFIDLDSYLRLRAEQVEISRDEPRLNPERVFELVKDAHTNTLAEWRRSVRHKMGGGFDISFLKWLGIDGRAERSVTDKRLNQVKQEIREHTRLNGRLPVSVRAFQVLDQAIELKDSEAWRIFEFVSSTRRVRYTLSSKRHAIAPTFTEGVGGGGVERVRR